MQVDRTFVTKENVFTSVPRIMFSDVLARVEVEYTGTQLRDARSAIRMLETKCGVKLSDTVASSANLRGVLETITPARIGISNKRWLNVRAILTKAVKRFGQPRTWVTQDIPLSPEWDALLKTIGAGDQSRWGLSRLASYCSALKITPQEITVDTLTGLFDAIEAEAISKNPRNLLKRTIASWNHCRKTMPFWPDIQLSSPFKSDPYMLPLEAFPMGFQNEVAAWEQRMSNPDPLDLDAPVRAYRPDTLKAYRFTFRRLATALIHSGLIAIGEMTGFGVFFEEQRFKAALRPFLKGTNGIETHGYAHKMATQLLAVARYHLGYDEKRLEPFLAITRRLKPRQSHAMGKRNRKRLEQFDDPNIVSRLLNFPEEELKRALSSKNQTRCAKGVERALAISLAIFTGLRIKNLRQLRYDRNIRRSGARVFVRISEDEAKTHEALELELPQDTITLLDLYLTEHRSRLPGSASPCLFAGENCEARSYSAMRAALVAPLLKHAGIHLSPHLYRHTISKIVIERNPELVLDLSRRLGHKSLRTTYAFYLGTETPAASRRISELLAGLRDGKDLGGKS